MSKSDANLKALPTEIMNLVVDSTYAKGKPVFSAEDVCDLRSTNRRVQKTMFKSWAKHCFTTRKRISSCDSIQCLLSIPSGIVLRGYVREVVVGPEKSMTTLVSY